MVAQFFGGTITMEATASSIYTLLNNISSLPHTSVPTRITSNNLFMRALDTNAGRVYIGLPGMDLNKDKRIGYLDPSESLSMDTQLVRVDLSSLYLSGIPGDKVEIGAIEL